MKRKTKKTSKFNGKPPKKKEINGRMYYTYFDDKYKKLWKTLNKEQSCTWISQYDGEDKAYHLCAKVKKMTRPKKKR